MSRIEEILTSLVAGGGQPSERVGLAPWETARITALVEEFSRRYPCPSDSEEAENEWRSDLLDWVWMAGVADGRALALANAAQDRAARLDL